jgi:hypothetical protein
MSNVAEFERRVQEGLLRRRRADPGRGDATIALAFALGTLVGGVLARVCAPHAREKTPENRQPAWRIQYTTSDPR